MSSLPSKVIRPEMKMSLPNFLKSPAARVPMSKGIPSEIIDLPDPDEVIIPLEYPGQILFQPMVDEGDEVVRNQVIGRSELGNCVHASISGRVKEIRTIWSARSFRVPAVVIERGDAPALSPEQTLSQCGLDLSSAGRLDLLKAGGVVSPWTLPGAGHIEGNPDDIPEIKHLVIWALNEETTIFSFESLLRESPEQALSWIRRVCELTPSALVHILVRRSQENWTRMTLGDEFQIVGIPEEYRHRIERVVIPRVTGIQVPNTRPFIEQGVAVMSMEQVQIAFDAFQGKPWTHKTVTLAGFGLDNPVTLRTPMGTTLHTLLKSQNMEAPNGGRVLMGGPMKGLAQFTDQTPVCKFHHGVFLVAENQLPSEVNLTCIGCGRCTQACPSNLQVHIIGRCVEFDLLLEAGSHHPEACHECGLCAFVCPSHRPLVQLVKIAKKYGG
jgi:Na+-translocating ferredoxin:NAD+ oxidoreductase subunit C